MPIILSSLAIGAVSGLIPTFIFFPIDTMKARMQLQGYGNTKQLYKNSISGFKLSFLNHGLKGFYAGFGAVAVCTVPGDALYFGGYELGKNIVPDSIGPSKKLLCGTIAQILGSFAYTPMDVVKERMQVRAISNTSIKPNVSFRAAIQELFRAKGIMRGFWLGNILWIPWSSLYVFSYDHLKDFLSLKTTKYTLTSQKSDTEIKSYSNINEELEDVNISSNFVLYGICSMLSSTFACILTHPIDLIRTQIQVRSGSDIKSEINIKSAQIIKEIFYKEGLKGFLKGLGNRIAVLAPQTALVWIIYEKLNHFIHN